jgi:hypothetical protein
MNSNAGELAKKLSRIQARLRGELLQELQSHGDELQAIFDPYSYSPLVHELRERYLTRLYLLQGIIQQLAHFSQGRSKHTACVFPVTADSRNELVRRVNRKLCKLNGSRVIDVKFMSADEDGDWSALITCELNPFAAEADGTAAWM